MRRGVLAAAAAAALVMLVGAGSASAQSPCAAEQSGDLYQTHQAAGCDAGAAAAGCVRDWAGDGYYTKDTTCSATASDAAASCHRRYESARGYTSAFDTIDCTVSAPGVTAGCTRYDQPTGFGTHDVTDDCAVTADGVSRDAHLDEGQNGAEIPDDPL